MAGPDPSVAPVRVGAPAKINLYLHILGRRADGYHLLDSLVTFAAIHDDLEFRPASDLTLVVDGPFAAALPDLDDNLVVEAARRLARTAGVHAGAAMRLGKNLPVAAGIGGGSADAAAALEGLCRLWKLTLPDEALAEIGLSLGADVPVCLFGRSAVMTGIGERLSPAPALPECPIVLVNPRVPVPTSAVFQALERHSGAPGPLPAAIPDVRALAAVLDDRVNDLAAAAAKVAPVIDDVLGALRGEGGCLTARLSGSGPTCFGLFADASRAAAAAAAIAAAHSRWWVRETTLI